MNRFVLDVHLGRLARDLRMLGFDAEWKESFTDPELLEIAREEGRALLTRDRALWESAPQDLRHYVKSEARDEQLLEVLHQFSLVETARSGKGFLSRCMQCNNPILPVKPHHVHHLVPGSVLTAHDDFYFCPRCERVYWKGSHWDRMREWVQKLLSD